MTEYYRVRTPEQWEWLMEWFEKDKAAWSLAECKPTQFNCPKRISEPVIRLNEDKSFDVFDINSVTMPDTIEVSDLMEENRMEDYVTIYGKDAEQIRTTSDGQVPIVKYHEPSGRLTPIFDIADGIDIPKSLLYPKVKFTEEEKREFDDIKKHVTALYNAMVLIFEHRDECINLNNKLFYSAPPKYLNDVQRDFARAWTDESLIEVIPDKKWNVKVPISHERDYYCKTASISGTTVVTFRVGNGSELWTDDDFQFTAEELKHYGLDNDLFEKVEASNAKEN